MLRLPVFRMGARMNDSIHAQVQVIELDPIWIWQGCVNRETSFTRQLSTLNLN